MNEQSKKKSNKLPVAIRLIAIIITVSLTIEGLSALVIYPTQTHKDAIRDFSQMSLKTNSDNQTTSDKAAYEKLQQTPELQYSIAVGIATSIVQLIAAIMVIGYTYGYIRKSRAFKKSAFSAAVLYVAGWSVTLSITSYAESIFITGLPFDGVYLVYGLIANLTLGLLTAYLVARIFQWRYNRKHSFIVE